MKRVLMVKISSLGDVVHAMPAVQDMLRCVPGVQVDWVVERPFAPLVRQVQGIGKVIESDLRKWRKSITAPETRQAWGAFRQAMYGSADEPGYDAVIDAQGLTKSALVSAVAGLSLTGKRYALANRTEGSSYEWPTRWVAHKTIRMPERTDVIVRARRLCAEALGYELPQTLEYGLLNNRQRKLGTLKTVVFAHGTSRADKLWPFEHWVALGKKFSALGYRVNLPHGSDEELTRAKLLAMQIPGAQVWARMPINLLAEALAGAHGVIGLDTGLSHIATAVNLPHVQIYAFDNAWRTGPPDVAQHTAPMRQVSVTSTGATPTSAGHPSTAEAVWAAWLKVAP